MNPNSDILSKLIDEDFGIEIRGRWGKSTEHDSLVLDTEKGIFFWNSKNIVGDPLTYLMKVRGFSFIESRNYLSKFDGYSETFVYTIKNDDEDVVVFPKLIDIFWKNGLQNREYWYNRCIKDSTIDRFRLGYFDGWFLIPVFIDGSFRNFQCRRDLPVKRIKMWYRGVGPLVYNADLLKTTDVIFITEGPIDSILLNQEGINAVSHLGGAEGWQQKWFKYFFKQRSIVYLGDNDKPGRVGARKVARSLGEDKTILYTFDGFEPKYDVVDFFRDGGTVVDLLLIINKEGKYLYEL